MTMKQLTINAIMIATAIFGTNSYANAQCANGMCRIQSAQTCNSYNVSYNRVRLFSGRQCAQPRCGFVGRLFGGCNVQQSCSQFHQACTVGTCTSGQCMTGNCSNGECSNGTCAIETAETYSVPAPCESVQESVKPCEAVQETSTYSCASCKEQTPGLSFCGACASVRNGVRKVVETVENFPLFTRINAVRRYKLRYSQTLCNEAVKHAQDMADSGELFHSSGASEICCYAYSFDEAIRVWQRSIAHANIMYGDFSQCGAGYCVDNAGRIWCCARFR